MGLQTCPACNSGTLYVYETETLTEKYCMQCAFEERIKHAPIVIERKLGYTSPKPWRTKPQS